MNLLVRIDIISKSHTKNAVMDELCIIFFSICTMSLKYLHNNIFEPHTCFHLTASTPASQVLKQVSHQTSSLQSLMWLFSNAFVVDSSALSWLLLLTEAIASWIQAWGESSLLTYEFAELATVLECEKFHLKNVA